MVEYLNGKMYRFFSTNTPAGPGHIFRLYEYEKFGVGWREIAYIGSGTLVELRTMIGLPN